MNHVPLFKAGQRAGLPYNATRGNVALAALGNALGVQLDATKPDHELLEQLASKAQAIAGALEYVREHSRVWGARVDGKIAEAERRSK